ncbi:phage holin family protein [Pseudotabrizicola sp. 4114]|uniref:phage holin family protein n=1 Tax=Pseudotabrizicola sp. 4114 TaxID=2817731 RepID=UPI00285ADE9B|nr:hypothetical protein [Pseudorhodobacter sp. 4114]
MAIDEHMPPENRTIPELLADLIRNLNGLVLTEGRLLRAEMIEAGRNIGAGLEIIAVGAVLMMVALLVLVQALVIALATWMGGGWASLLVGGLLVLIGIALILRGRADLRSASLTAERTMEQVRRDVQLAKEQL